METITFWSWVQDIWILGEPLWLFGAFCLISWAILERVHVKESMVKGEAGNTFLPQKESMGRIQPVHSNKGLHTNNRKSLLWNLRNLPVQIFGTGRSWFASRSLYRREG